MLPADGTNTFKLLMLGLLEYWPWDKDDMFFLLTAKIKRVAWFGPGTSCMRTWYLRSYKRKMQKCLLKFLTRNRQNWHYSEYENQQHGPKPRLFLWEFYWRKFCALPKLNDKSEHFKINKIQTPACELFLLRREAASKFSYMTLW